MKRRLLIGLLLVITILCLFFSINNHYKENVNSRKLLDYEQYKIIKKNNIKNIEIVRLTEGGSNSKTIEDEISINEIYNMLNKKYIGRKSNFQTDDNTTLYIFELNDGNKVTIEIEADMVVIDNVRYFLK